MLDGIPIIVHVLNILKKSLLFDAICVSSDDNSILEIAENNGAITLGPRDESLSDDYCDFLRLVKEDIPRFEKHLNLGVDYEFFMVLPTAALITVADLKSAYAKFTKNAEQFHFAAKLYDVSAFWAFIEKDGKVLPLHKEMLTKRSQDLPITFCDAGLFYILKSIVIKTSIDTWFNNERVGYSLIDANRAVDVDNVEDWETLEREYYLIYRH